VRQLIEQHRAAEEFDRLALYGQLDQPPGWPVSQEPGHDDGRIEHQPQRLVH
jgi:hypothetical protein